MPQGHFMQAVSLSLKFILNLSLAFHLYFTL